MFFHCFLCHFYPFSNCFTISLTSAFLLHLPCSLSPCGYLWAGMCRASQRAHALVMCGCRRPPSPIAPADITDNYSNTTVKTRCCHTQSRSAWWKRDEEGVLRRGDCECVFVLVSVGVYHCTCVWLVLMAVLAAFEHRSVSQTVSQVCHFKISPREIRPTGNQSSAVSQV